MDYSPLFDLTLAGSPEDWALLESVMIYPDDEVKRESLRSSVVAENTISLWVEHGRPLPPPLWDEFRRGTDFLIDHAGDITDRRKKGWRAGCILSLICSMNVRRREILLVQPSREAELAIKPSLEKAIDLAIGYCRQEEREKGVTLGASSHKTLTAAWALMKPVAHLWAAMQARPVRIASGEYAAATSSMKKSEREQFDYFSTLRDAKTFLWEAGGIKPHGSTTPIFDQGSALWVTEETDSLLGRALPDELGNERRAVLETDLRRFTGLARNPTKSNRPDPSSGVTQEMNGDDPSNRTTQID